MSAASQCSEAPEALLAYGLVWTVFAVIHYLWGGAAPDRGPRSLCRAGARTWFASCPIQPLCPLHLIYFLFSLILIWVLGAYTQQCSRTTTGSGDPKDFRDQIGSALCKARALLSLWLLHLILRACEGRKFGRNETRVFQDSAAHDGSAFQPQLWLVLPLSWGAWGHPVHALTGPFSVPGPVDRKEALSLAPRPCEAAWWGGGPACLGVNGPADIDQEPRDPAQLSRPTRARTREPVTPPNPCQLSPVSAHHCPGSSLPVCSLHLQGSQQVGCCSMLS